MAFSSIMWLSFLHIMFNIFWFTIGYDKLVEELRSNLFWLLWYVICIMTNLAFIITMVGGIA